MEDLKDLIINTLDAQGVLGEIRAQLRMLVFKSIDNEGKQLPYDKTPAMQLADSDQGRLCLELLRDFLAFFKLNLSLNVLLPETRLTEEMQPEKLRELLGFRPEPGTPLLFQILDKLSEPDPQPRPMSKPEAQPWPREEEKDTQDFAGGRGANAFNFPGKKPAEIPKDKPAEKKPQEIPQIPAFNSKPVDKKPADIPQIPPFREKPNEPSPFKDKEPSRDFPAFKDKPAEAPKQPKPAEVSQLPAVKDKPKEIARPAEVPQVAAFKDKPKEVAKPAEVPAIPDFREKPKNVAKPAEVPAIPAFKDKPREVAKPAEIPAIPAFKAEEKKGGKLAPLREPMGRRLALDEDDTNEPEKERLRDIGRTLEQMQRADKAGKQVDMQALDLDDEVEEDLEDGSLEHLGSEEGDQSFHSDMLGAFDHAEDAEPFRRRS